PDGRPFTRNRYADSSDWNLNVPSACGGCGVAAPHGSNTTSGSARIGATVRREKANGGFTPSSVTSRPVAVTLRLAARVTCFVSPWFRLTDAATRSLGLPLYAWYSPGASFVNSKRPC